MQHPASRRLRLSLAVSLLLAATIGLLAGVSRPRPLVQAAGSSVPVGSGSYNTALPPGAPAQWCSGNYSCLPPSNINNQPVSPKATANVPAGTFPTDRWWTSLAYDYRAITGAAGSQYGQPMKPHPLQLAGHPSSIGVAGMPAAYTVVDYPPP